MIILIVVLIFTISHATILCSSVFFMIIVYPPYHYFILAHLPYHHFILHHRLLYRLYIKVVSCAISISSASPSSPLYVTPSHSPTFYCYQPSFSLFYFAQSPLSRFYLAPYPSFPIFSPPSFLFGLVQWMNIGKDLNIQKTQKKTYLCYISIIFLDET